MSEAKQRAFAALRGAIPLILSTHLILVLIPPVECTDTDGRVRVICLGDVIDQYGGFNSFVVIRDDPAIITTLVPSRPDYVSREVAIRNLRVYMPRTYEAYVSGQDVTVISDCDRRMIKPEWIGWMADSVSKGGLGFLWLGSLASQDQAFQSWEGTTLAGIAPVRPAPRLDIWGSFRLVKEKAEEPLMGSLPWAEAPVIRHFNTQTPKQGSQVWARSDPLHYPLITFWSVGNGRVLCFSAKFPKGMENWAREWRFFPQAMIYMTYRVGGREIPSDPIFFETITRAFREHRERDSLIASILDFAERFGARVEGVHAREVELERRRREAEALYVARRYTASLDLMRRIEEEQRSLIEKAMKTKDQALLWVYLTEWLAIFGTLMLSSFLLWSLMIRRRLYADVGLTTHRRS